ncbi:SIR2 family NAD-dependent protein deacylase [Pseudomonas syringae]|uniref:SIR2 family NAD-dependent protein deacylase n=1 Tax=Pseudomonas syringae TaxID=317 RepID=UPI001BCF8284|nr:SIR2 family protein [Pseudomonas syringae]MBS7416996.1 SIR2 family protein [Pseudomonas syringae]
MMNLKNVLAQSDTIIFVGSGISLWSGLPTWSGMIEELAVFLERDGRSAELVRAEARKGDLLQAASYGFDKLTKQQIGEFIREACRYGKAKPHQIHQKIVSLGPRCFITTNYDNLVEESLRLWQRDRFYAPPVTNRHLTATAEIVSARSTDFIFKPHGDAADSESIILTREQYRRLLPQGESQAALESVKILLASRPVVYLGFGLRDPDFMFVRDWLTNIYKGGVRDHYAVMADVREQEVDYWRDNYGIHLVGYNTLERPDKTRDHSPLITLLDNLLDVPESDIGSLFDPNSSDVLLALARHAAVLSRYSIRDPEFPIRVKLDGDRKRSSVNSSYRFGFNSVEKLLESGPVRLVLTGLPGAGKSYSLRRAAARLADKLNDICLSTSLRQEEIVVPIVVDLKFYKGDLNALVSQVLPESLPFHELIKSYKVKIFIDSFNEMPREYLENGSYEADFLNFTAMIGSSSLVIGSRTTDGLSRLELPTFRLDFIERHSVVKKLRQLGVSFEGRFSDEMLRLIQRPFYFQYILSGKIELPDDAHPKDFYRCLFENVSSAFYERFQFYLNIEKVLSSTAYTALDKGAEAFLISDLRGDLSGVLPTDSQIVPLDVINWLVSESILIPYSKGRIGFVHQSITEYLAATELARRYVLDPSGLKEKLSLRRWDQGLFLTLSFLSDQQAKEFIADVVAADMALAINASKYVESGREEVVTSLLDSLYSLKSNGVELSPHIESSVDNGLQVSKVHEPIIRKLINFGGVLGGSAVCLLVSISENSVKQEVLQMLYEQREDFNFCYGAVGSIIPYVTKEDAVMMAHFSDLIQKEVELNPELDEEHYAGFCIALGRLLGQLDLEELVRYYPIETKELGVNKFRAKLLCYVLRENISTESLSFAADLLLRGVDEAASAVVNIAVFSHGSNDVSWDSLTCAHVSRLQELIEELWVIEALKIFCAARSDIAEYVKEKALSSEGLVKVALLYCASPTEMAPVFCEIEKILALDTNYQKTLPFDILSDMDIDWSGQELLFVQVLRSKNLDFISPILGSSIPVRLDNLGILDIGNVIWLLEWMRDMSEDANNQWFLARLGDVLANHADSQAKAAILNEFNLGTEFRMVILDFIIQRMDVTTDEIDAEAISFLLADLSRERGDRFIDASFLGTAATEAFIVERLFPLLISAQDPLKENILSVLDQAGTRHGRRYLVESRVQE